MINAGASFDRSLRAALHDLSGAVTEPLGAAAGLPDHDPASALVVY